MTPRQTLAKIRKLLKSVSRDDVAQGIDLAETVAVPEVTAAMTSGISIDAQDRLRWNRNSEIEKRVKKPHRPWAAMRIARMAGILDGVESLDLSQLKIWSDLSPLAGLTDLKSLKFGDERGDVDLTTLGELPALERLDLGRRYDLSSLDGLAGMTNLRSLRVHASWSLSDLSPLRALTQLESLTLTQCSNFRDLAPLAGLTALTTLDLGGCRGVIDLAPLAGLTALTKLDVHRTAAPDLAPLSGLTALTDLSVSEIATHDLAPLAGLTGLQKLEIHGLRELTDVSALSGLTALTALDLSYCTQLADLSPLAGLTELTSLNLRWCGNARDLSPLAGLTGLTSLSIEGTNPASTEPLRGLSGLAEGVSVDAQGWPVRHGSRMSGSALYLALQVDGDHLDGVKHLKIQSAREMYDLDRLAAHTGLETVELANCYRVSDLAGLIPLTALRSLELSACNAVTPKPRRTALETRDAVQEYQQSLARSLKRKRGRTPFQETLLESAKAQGLLQRTAAEAARREARKIATQIRKFLTSRDRDDARQGYELLMALGDPDVIAEFADGVSLSDQGRIVVSEAAKRRAHLRSRYTRSWAALAVLRASGALDEATSLDLSSEYYLNDLSPLEGLESLSALHLSGSRLVDLNALWDMPALESLTMQLNYSADNLDALEGMENLKVLRLTGNYRVTDLSPLSTLTGLTELQLNSFGQATDVRPIGRIPNLTKLQLLSFRVLKDISPLARLQALESLSLNWAYELLDLSPILDMPALNELSLQQCSKLPYTYRKQYGNRAEIRRLVSQYEAQRTAAEAG